MKKIFLTLFLLALSTGILAQEGSTAAVDVKPPEGKKATVKDVLEYFVDEPTIQEVQATAIEYAEVHPDKILKWRKKAKYKAWLPDLGLKFQQDRDSAQSRYQSISGDSTLGMYEKVPYTDERMWYATVGWDLSDLIWNSAQTSIDTRSRLMVQLRNDVLDEVTRTYFERRRLQIEMLLSPPEDMREKIEQQLRIQELTANIDALTGGYLSRRLKEAKEKKEKQTK